MDEIVDEKQYFALMFSWMPQSVVTDEDFEDNRELLEDISDKFFYYNSISGQLPPEVGRKVLELVFTSIQRYGIV